MNILAIIPARGGSKGIPHKNIQFICGKPMLAWSILSARASRYITRLVVSTDSADIARVSQQYGAEVVWRPLEISGDTASSESALLYTLTHLKQAENYHPDLLVFLQCTSPLTAVEDIDGCIAQLFHDQADTATTVTDFHYFLWKNTPEGVLGINHDQRFRPRRQDREKQFLETGAVYVMRTEGFLQYKHRFFGKTVLFSMPAERVQEIDAPIDLLIADIRLRQLLSHKRQNILPLYIEAVVFDFDGVMTNNHVLINEFGQEAVICDRGDGMGISKMKEIGIRVSVMSSETNPVVLARCQKLKIDCWQSLGQSKHESLLAWCKKEKIRLENTIYMGNDTNDVTCMQQVGCAVAPADCHPEILPYANIVLMHEGGQGAVRELCDMILQRNKQKQ